MGSLPAGSQSRLLALCRWFLAGTAGNDEATNGDNFFYLVPAGRLFENFLTGFIRSHFPGWGAESQSAAYLGFSSGKLAAPVRNDLWLPEKKLVVEIKYKKIPPGPAGVPATDIYQSLAYAVARQTSNVHLLYPASPSDQEQGFRIEIPLQANRMPVILNVHFVPVLLPPAAEGEGYSAGSFALLTQNLQEKLRKAIGQ
jgi:5-methylcytosine-specific restriction endonuclease McrBC regulatory subunit McrC